jgi:O-methyltransferase involved in polyketide biosynthesis
MSRDNLHVIAANVLDNDELQAAVKPFRPDQPIAIVNEGLLQYLSRDEMTTVARHVGDLLAEFGGIWITPDFSVKAEVRDISEQQRQFRRIVAAATERKLYNNAFDNKTQLQQFLTDLELEAQVYQQMELVPHLVSLDKLHLSPELVTQSKLKLWVLRYQPKLAKLTA